MPLVFEHRSKNNDACCFGPCLKCNNRNWEEQCEQLNFLVCFGGVPYFNTLLQKKSRFLYFFIGNFGFFVEYLGAKSMYYCVLFLR